MRPSATYDDMVIERDADEFARLYKPLSLDNVFVRWCGITARMVVRDDHRYRAKAYRMTEDFSWMYKCLVSRTARDYHRLAEKTTLRVEIESIRALLSIIDADGTHLSHHVVGCFDCTGKRTM